MTGKIRLVRLCATHHFLSLGTAARSDAVDGSIEGRFALDTGKRSCKAL